MTKLSGIAKQALADYSDMELAVLVSDKRMKDYKTALSNRNVRLMGFHWHIWLESCCRIV
ncbi:hypothetical protein [uncultured Cohaesibacter sp.]|uniref:hypothetical protein n=1 Tax=uncultured Cohaesibacter sp. TaxID=1002546 RepID=UPI002930ECA2|nr:hypothetical protein [uncultured Cohaesibacter sp.]